MKSIFLFSFNIALIGNIYGQIIDDNIANMMSEGWRQQTTYQNIRKGNLPPKQIDIDLNRSDYKEKYQDLINLMDRNFENSQTRALLIAKDGQLIYERYLSGKTSRRSTPIGNSMSKSLVSLAVGKSLCDGSISSISVKSKTIHEGLSGTSWGEASVLDLLKMSSGAFYTDPQRPTGWKNQEDIQINRAIYSRQLQKSFLELMQAMDNKEFIPGSRFNYNNYDTVALNLIVEKATRKGFSKYFEDSIWKDVLPEASGAWVTNEKGEAAGYFGFSATPRDWIRIGQYVLESLPKNDCFGQYLREATREQIVANWPVNHSYGYQIWTKCTTVPDSFCFIGNHGQQLIFDPKNNIVLYAHASSNSTNSIWRTAFQLIHR